MNLDELKEALRGRLKELKLEDKGTWLEAIITAAVKDYSRFRPRTLSDTLTLEAGTAEYDKPAGFISFKSTRYGRPKTPVAPWDRFEYSAPPLPRVIELDGNLLFEPAPDAALIAAYGSSFNYLYAAEHSVSANSSTVPVRDDDIIILRAEAEAMRLIAENRADKPAFRDGYNQASNSTYGGLWGALMEEFNTKIGANGAVIVRQ